MKAIDENRTLLWLALFVGLVVTHIPWLLMPASFDSTWSVMAAAQYLVDNNFDLFELLQLPGFAERGPSSHAATISTYITAIVVAAVGTGPLSLVIRHLIHLAMGATALWFSYQTGRTVLDRKWSLISTIIIAFTPTVFAQFGTMYLETPLLMFCMAALYFFQRERYGLVTISLILAANTKASGVVLAATLLLVALVYRRSAAWKLTVATALATVTVLLTIATRQSTNTDVTLEMVVSAWTKSTLFIATTTPFAILLSLHVLTTLAWLRKRHNSGPTTAALIIFPWSFIALHYLAPVVNQPYTILPRYSAIIMPAMTLALAWALATGTLTLPVRSTMVGYVAVVGVGLWGFLLPAREASNSILSERSALTKTLIDLEADAIDRMIQTGATPVVALDTWARLTYPTAGFVDRPVETMIYAGDLLDSNENIRTDDLPDSVVFLVRALDGSQAALDPEDLDESWSVEIVTLTNGPISMDLVTATRND